MAVTFPEIRVGSPVQYDRLSIFPLFLENGDEVEYVLSDQAINDGKVLVEEVSEAGSVPELSVENKGDVRVLFLEGEELIGAKQNRVLNTSVLIAAHTKTKIPVSCVEYGRWGYRSREFGSGGTHSSSKLRRVLKSSVSRSLKAKGGYTSDQGEVWSEVSRQQESLGACSATSAMYDTYETHRARVEEYGKKLVYVPGAYGMAVAVAGQVVACDFFDKPSTCKKVWERMLWGLVLDALEAPRNGAAPEPSEVDRIVSGLRDLPWDNVAPVGEGEEFRAESPSGDHASALSFDKVVIHGSLVTA